MPIDRGIIDGQLRDIGESERWWEQREFRDLPHVLRSDERIHGIVVARLYGPRLLRVLPSRPRPLARPWLLVATDQRLLCLRRQRFGRKQLELRPDQLTGMRQGRGLRTCRITLDTAQGGYRLRIRKRDAFRFLGALAPLMPRPAVAPPSAGPPAASWLSGTGTIAAIPGLAGLVSKVAPPSAPDASTRRDLARVESALERLEGEVERLQQQVDFLEELLRRRAERVPSLPGAPAEP